MSNRGISTKVEPSVNESVSAAGVGKRCNTFFRLLNSLWKFSGCRTQQTSETFSPRSLAPCSKNPAQRRKAREIDVLKKRSIGDQKSCARILQLVAYFAFVVRRIEKGRNASSKRGRVISYRKLPGVRQEYCYDFSQSKPRRDKATSKRFN